MNLIEFLKDIAEFNDLILINKRDEVISEVRGKFSIEAGEEWLTVKNEGCRCHIHAKLAHISSAKFITNQNKEGRGMYAIEFLNEHEDLLFKISYPTKSDLESSQTAFKALESKYGDGQSAVQFLREEVKL